MNNSNQIVNVIAASKSEELNGITLVFMQGNEPVTAVVTGSVFANVLNGVGIPVTEQLFRKISGMQLLCKIENAVAGVEFTRGDGSTDTYKKDHLRLTGLVVLNANEIYSRLDVTENANDKAFFANQITFEKKGSLSAIKSSLLGSSKPVVIDNVPADVAADVVDESLETTKPEKPAAKPSAKALEAAQ